MTIKIRGFTLPPLLEKLMNEGMWVDGTRLTIPKPLLDRVQIPWEVTVSLIGIDQITRDNTDEVWFANATADSFAFMEFVMAYQSSKRCGKSITDTTKLDVDRAICIAWDIGDDLICLDCRFKQPKVVILNYDVREWRTLAPDFETFAKEVGLIK